MRDKQHSFPLRIYSRLSVWKTTKVKMCRAGGGVSTEYSLLSVFLPNRVKEIQVKKVQQTFPILSLYF